MARQTDLGQTDDDGASSQESTDDWSGQKVCHEAKAQEAQDQINDGDQQGNLHQPDVETGCDVTAMPTAGLWIASECRTRFVMICKYRVTTCSR